MDDIEEEIQDNADRIDEIYDAFQDWISKRQDTARNDEDTDNAS